MTAKELFSDARRQVMALEAIRREISALRASQGVSGASGGGAGAHAGGSVLCMGDRLYDLEEREKAMSGSVEKTLGNLTDVLYGRSGRGGVVLRLGGSAEADCVCGYYLMAKTWPQVAVEMARLHEHDDVKDVASWCRHRARRAFRVIDEIGVARLRDS